MTAAAAPDLTTDEELSILDDPLEQQRFTRWQVDAAGRRTADSSLRIGGMHCAACAGLIEAALGRVDGVLEARVSAAGERARVRWDPARTGVPRLVRAIRAAGYDAAPDTLLPAREQRQREARGALWRLFVAAFCAMQVMMLATPGYVSHGSELAPDLGALLNWGSWLLSLPVMVFSATPFLRGAWRSLRARRIGMDVPVSLGILVTFIASSGAAFDPAGPFGHEVYFDSLTMFISFLLGGRWLETRARHQAGERLEQAFGSLPRSAWRVADDGRVEVVSIGRLRVGDRLRVPLGQAFPADGELLEGSTRADESMLTGESTPVDKHAGDALVGGSLNLGAPVLMRVQRVGADTRLEGIVALMHDAMAQRPAIARSAERWAAPFLWCVLGLAAAAAAVWSVVDPSRAAWVAVSVLIVTCPCALSLAAPSAMLAAAGALARRGVLVQRLDALDALSRVQRVVFDKTGTLTEDRLAIERVVMLQPPPGLDEASLTQRAAALAGWSRHPLSVALAALADPAASSPPWSAAKEWPGEGLQANDAAGRCWRLGSASFAGPPPSGGLEAASPSGPAVWLSIDGIAAARFEFAEVARADAAAAVRALQSQGLAVSLLSGDRSSQAQALAARLGIGEAVGDATPQDKLAHVRAAQARGEVVAMVGDGLNDAPVLAQADVSLAMGQGALIARAQADAILLGGRLLDVATLRTHARATMRIVRQNLLWAAAYNGVCIPLALAGWLPPWAAGLGMATSSLFVIANAMRLSRA